MSTKIYNLTPTAWVHVSNSACLVELGQSCKHVFVHTAEITTPAIGEQAYHSLNTSDARTFSYGGGHNVYARTSAKNGYVIVTGDDLV